MYTYYFSHSIYDIITNVTAVRKETPVLTTYVKFCLKSGSTNEFVQLDVRSCYSKEMGKAREFEFFFCDKHCSNYCCF